MMNEAQVERQVAEGVEKLVKFHDEVRGSARATANLVERVVERLIGDEGLVPQEPKECVAERSGLFGSMYNILHEIESDLASIRAAVERL